MTTLTMTERAVLVVDGVSVATRTVASGRPLVLLHRFRGTLDDWGPAFVSAAGPAQGRVRAGRSDAQADHQANGRVHRACKKP